MHDTLLILGVIFLLWIQALCFRYHWQRMRHRHNTLRIVVYPAHIADPLQTRLDEMDINRALRGKNSQLN